MARLNAARYLGLLGAFALAGCGARSLGDVPPGPDPISASGENLSGEVLLGDPNTAIRPNGEYANDATSTPDGPDSSGSGSEVAPAPGSSLPRNTPAPVLDPVATPTPRVEATPTPIPDWPSMDPPEHTPGLSTPPPQALPDLPDATPTPPPLTNLPELPPPDDLPSNPRQPGEPIWVYIRSSGAALVDLQNGDRIEGLPALNLTDTLGTPWSRDGQHLVTLERDTLVYWDLLSGQERMLVTTGAGTTLLGWVANFGPLYHYYYQGQPMLFLSDTQGSAIELAMTAPMARAVRVLEAPSGNDFMYAAVANGEGAVFWSRVNEKGFEYALKIKGGGPEIMSQARWSSDGSWFAFSQTNEGELFVYRPGVSELPILVGNFSSAFEFSPANNALLNYSEGQITLTTLGTEGAVETQPVDAPRQTSPARFSLDGRFIYYAAGAEGGELRAIDDRGLGQAQELPGFAFDCPLYWWDTSRFFYQQCATAPERLVYGMIQGSTVVYWIILDTLLPKLELSPRQNCFVTWGPRELRLGRFYLPDGNWTFTHVAQSELSHVRLDLDDSVLLWVEGGSTVHWLPLTSTCEVTSQPASIREPASIRDLGFVPRQ